MKVIVLLVSVFTCITFLEVPARSNDPKSPQETNAPEKQVSEAKAPPPEMAMLTAIDDDHRGRYTVVYWETQLKDGVVSWNSKPVEKSANLDSVIFHVIGGKKGVKGANAVESLRKRLPLPILMTKNGKDLDPYYEAFYRPGVVVMYFPSRP